MIGGGNTALDAARSLVMRLAGGQRLSIAGAATGPLLPTKIHEAQEENVPIEFYRAPSRSSRETPESSCSP